MKSKKSDYDTQHRCPAPRVTAVSADTLSNFAFLSKRSTQLARLGELAERAFYFDPITTLVKLRQFAETLAKRVAAHHGTPLPTNLPFGPLLRLLRDRVLLPGYTFEYFDYLRVVGNTAVHQNKG